LAGKYNMESILYFVSLKIYYRLFVRIYLRNRGRIAQIEKPPTEAGGGLFIILRGGICI